MSNGSRFDWLVFLHTWSGSIEQGPLLIGLAKQRGWVMVAPDFRGINDHPEACASDLASQDIVDAVEYAKALHALVVWLGICDGNMQEGSFRCDANVSLRPKGSEAFGTRAELKNMNSFRNVERAIAFELERQAETLAEGASSAGSGDGSG